MNASLFPRLVAVPGPLSKSTSYTAEGTEEPSPLRLKLYQYFPVGNRPDRTLTSHAAETTDHSFEVTVEPESHYYAELSLPSGNFKEVFGRPQIGMLDPGNMTGGIEVSCENYGTHRLTSGKKLPYEWSVPDRYKPKDKVVGCMSSSFVPHLVPDPEIKTYFNSNVRPVTRTLIGGIMNIGIDAVFGTVQEMLNPFGVLPKEFFPETHALKNIIPKPVVTIQEAVLGSHTQVLQAAMWANMKIAEALFDVAMNPPKPFRPSAFVLQGTLEGRGRTGERVTLKSNAIRVLIKTPGRMHAELDPEPA